MYFNLRLKMKQQHKIAFLIRIKVNIYSIRFRVNPLRWEERFPLKVFLLASVHQVTFQTGGSSFWFLFMAKFYGFSLYDRRMVHTKFH